MADQVQYRGGSAAQLAGFTPAPRECVVDTTQALWRVGDGTTPGGWQGARSLVLQSLTGASQSYGAATLWCQLHRSNAGAAMTDTGPTLAALAGIAAGAPILVANNDAAATLTRASM